MLGHDLKVGSISRLIVVKSYHDRISGGKLWKGEAGYNIPRWEFWRSRFEELKRHPVQQRRQLKLVKLL